MSNSIFQTKKHDDLSENYNFVSTDGLIEKFLSMGYEVTRAQQARVRRPDHDGYQKHIVTFSHNDLWIDENNRIEILLTNAHNGSSSVKLQLGVYRLVCSNGLVVGSTFDSYSVRHVGFTYDKLEEAAIAITSQVPKIKEILCKMKNIDLNEEEIREFTSECFEERLKGVNNLISFENNVKPLRQYDQNNDLYTVLNRVQERVIKRGIHYRTMKQEINKWGIKEISFNKGKTREVKGIDNLIKLNKFVFDKAMELIEKKAA